MLGEFQFLEVKGSRYQIGTQLGEALRDKLPRVLEDIVCHEMRDNWTRYEGGNAERLSIEYDSVLTGVMRFLPLFEFYCPGLIEEVRGIAQGANLSFEEALLLQIRGEVLYAFLGGCSTFVYGRSATSSGEIIIGQNWDNVIEPDLLFILRVVPENGPAYLTFTIAGISAYMGISANGVGQFANALPWHGCKLGIPHYPFKWMVFQQGDIVDIQELAHRTMTVLPGNYVLCDGKGEIADLELTPEGNVWLKKNGDFFVHTNHFLGKPYANRPDLKPSWPDSLSRYTRLAQLSSQNVGQIDVPLVQQMMSDHDGFPHSICRHGILPQPVTLSCLIAEPEQRRMHVCAGNPCQGRFKTYSL